MESFPVRRLAELLEEKAPPATLAAVQTYPERDEWGQH